MKGTKTEIRPGVWRLRVYAGRRANGSPIQITKTVHAQEAKPGAGVRLAERELATMVAKVASGEAVAKTETVAGLLDKWLAHCDAIGRSPTTMREHRRLVTKVIVPAIGHVKLTKLTARHLDQLYAKLTAEPRPLAPASVRRCHAVIGAALHQAEKWDLVARNVARRAQPPELHQARVEAPSPEEVQAIIRAAEAIEPGLAALLVLAALTGARRGELCALRWPDVDLAGARLTIARSVYETPGGGWGEKDTKTHAARSVGLDELALEVLRRHRLAVDTLADDLGLDVLPDGFVFSRSPVGAEPIRPDVLSKFTKRVAEKAGVDTHLHALRHFSATQAIAAGFDPVTVSGRLGHADPAITLRVYSHALEQRDRELAAALGRTLALSPG